MLVLSFRAMEVVANEKIGLQWISCRPGPGQRWRLVLVCARPAGLCALAAHSLHSLKQFSLVSISQPEAFLAVVWPLQQEQGLSNLN